MRLLLVEDDERLAGHLLRGLRQELHTVDLVQDGREALDYADLLNEGLYDVVILDILLPGLGGLEVRRQWRGLRVAVPVLILTALRTVPDRVEGSRCRSRRLSDQALFAVGAERTGARSGQT